jgi:Xaa-Pro aminopeptidase
MICCLVSLGSVGAASAEPESAGKSVGPDVPPEIPASIYKARRDRLAAQLGPCVGVLKAHDQADGGIDEYFYYLTGIDESGAMLLLAPREPIYRQRIGLRPRDPELEVWEGYREPMSPGLAKQYQVDMVSRVRGGVPRGLGDSLRHSRCYATLRPSFRKEEDIPAEMLGKYLTSFGARTEQRWQQLEKLRAVHDATEIALMDKAIAITIEGHRAAARELRAGVRERLIASKIEDAFFEHGATGLAFPSIVGAGANGAILHWEKRNAIIAADDLVVVDIGSAYGHYASDVTRTYPVSGTFSPEQRKVYEVVLAAQEKAIAAVRPGVSLDKLNQIAEDVIVAAGYEPSHYVGHFVGLNVHDVGDTSGALEAGMVITVEPGIYLKGKFGVRIEDMVLVTARGGKLMTADLPRKVSEVESWIKKARGQ